MRTFIIVTFILLLTLSHSNLYSQWQFTEQTSGVTTQLTSVSMLQNALSSNAWICGYSGVVLRTTNAGTNWLNVSGNGIPATVSLINICAIDANTAVTAGYIGTTTYVYRTTNAGANWTQVFTEANGFIDAIRKLPTSLFMAGDPVGGRWSLWKSTNNGATWDSTGLYLPAATGTEAGWNNAMYTAGNKIWIGTNNSRIYYSSNSGQNFVSQSTAPEVNSYAIYFENSNNYGLAGGATLLKTTNGGNNWTVITASGTGNFGGIAGTDLFTFQWYVRGTNTIYYGNQGGAWNTAYTAPAGTYRYIGTDVSFYSNIYAVRNNGGISKSAYVLEAITPVSNEAPAEYSLSQNYPNPFNPTTNIRIYLPEAAFVKIVIYDALGNDIDKLINSKLNSGIYSYDWNASKYTSGVYFYSLFASGVKGVYTDTKKMLLVK